MSSTLDTHVRPRAAAPSPATTPQCTEGGRADAPEAGARMPRRASRRGIRSVSASQNAAAKLPRAWSIAVKSLSLSAVTASTITYWPSLE